MILSASVLSGSCLFSCSCYLLIDLVKITLFVSFLAGGEKSRNIFSECDYWTRMGLLVLPHPPVLTLFLVPVVILSREVKSESVTNTETQQGEYETFISDIRDFTDEVRYTSVQKCQGPFIILIWGHPDWVSQVIVNGH